MFGKSAHRIRALAVLAFVGVGAASGEACTLDPVGLTRLIPLPPANDASTGDDDSGPREADRDAKAAINANKHKRSRQGS